MTEPNPFAQFFDPHQQALIGTIIEDDNDDGSVFDAAIIEQFEAEMGVLADQVPEDDEEQANAMMRVAVQNLMVRSFRAGMLFQHQMTPDTEADPDAIVFAIDPQGAAQMLMGLMSGEGAALRLVVDRGQD